MAAVNLSDADRIRVVGLPVDQQTLPPETGVVINKGNVVTVGPNGGWALAAPGGSVYGVATGKTGQGPGITAIRVGILDGFDLTTIAHAAKIYVGAAGTVDSAGAATDAIGFVTGGTANTLGSPISKLFKVDCSGK